MNTGKFTDLKALYINCSLKKDKNGSHTQKLMDRSAAIMKSQGVLADEVYMLDYSVAFGMDKDMTKAGWERDDWPLIQEKIIAANILVVGSPIWLGNKSSLATLVIERMYAFSGDRNEKGQYLYYGKTAGCIITGNEDGIKHCSMDILYSLQHVGYTIPPQADAGWIGEAGPGPSYGDTDEKTGKVFGLDNEFTNRNTTFMTWNLMHMAQMLKNSHGIPAEGNTVAGWEHVANAKHQNPEYH